MRSHINSPESFHKAHLLLQQILAPTSILLIYHKMLFLNELAKPLGFIYLNHTEVPMLLWYLQDCIISDQQNTQIQQQIKALQKLWLDLKDYVRSQQNPFK